MEQNKEKKLIKNEIKQLQEDFALKEKADLEKAI
jgi:hypothetical protein